MLPQLTQFTDLSLLLLRFMVAAVFVNSGWNDFKDPQGRAQSIGLNKGLTVFLGAAELAGGLGVATGVLTQPAAIGLILIMLGAIQKKIFVWHSGFWGEKGYGWHYDLMLAIINLVIACTGGGRYVLWK
ncbi:MAG TPA: DoxX family protein [Desulfuromonadaceae bacterium]|jgi:putative oxidoreductase